MDTGFQLAMNEAPVAVFFSTHQGKGMSMTGKLKITHTVKHTHTHIEPHTNTLYCTSFRITVVSFFITTETFKWHPDINLVSTVFQNINLVF